MDLPCIYGLTCDGFAGGVHLGVFGRFFGLEWNALQAEGHASSSWRVTLPPHRPRLTIPS
jgi:hypothetical protein